MCELSILVQWVHFQTEPSYASNNICMNLKLNIKIFDERILLVYYDLNPIFVGSLIIQIGNNFVFIRLNVEISQTYLEDKINKNKP